MSNQRYHSRSRARKRRRQTEYRQTGALGKLLVMLTVVSAIVLGVAIFFRVGAVDVQGNTIYSTEQVITASGLEAGDNLLMVNRAAVAGRIKAMMPYVRDVSVSPSLPDTVVIQIRESEVAVLVKSDVGAEWYVNTDGRVMGTTVEGFRGQIITVDGITITAPKAGEAAVASEEQADSLQAALQVIRQMEGTGLLEQITKIDASKVYDMVLWCGNRLEILLGGNEDLEYKMQYLQVILQDLEDYQTGTIDLTFDVDRVARFIERAATEEEVPETDETDEAEPAPEE